MDLQPVLQQRAKVEEFARKHRIGLLTLVFTDVVGSTRLKQVLGEVQAIPLLQWHRQTVREILQRFKEAVEIETAGDSFFIVFAKPSDAVKFALVVQSNLRGAAQQSGRAILDRIGIHVGEVFIEEHEGGGKARDLYGLQVDVGARVMSLAEGDQILLTRSAFDNARQVLKGQEIGGLNKLNELQWLNHGPYVLKGVEEPLEICEVGEVGQAVLKPPPDSEKVHRFVSPDAEPVLGWRPALGQAVAGTSWVLEEKLGEGGFGEVWLGRHKTTKERRVFKFCFRADRVRSLKREVTLFRVLKQRLGEHLHIAGVQDVYLEEPPYYLTMEYVEGRDLKTWSEKRGGMGAIPLETRLEIVAQVAEALQAAHEAGVIHRDVKPANILIRESRESARREGTVGEDSRALADHTTPHVKLTDFGIGQVVSEETLAGITRLGFTETMLSPGRATPAGTYLYMAPELLAGKPASKQSDVYSLGVVLYQLLVGDFSLPLTTDWASAIDDPILREDVAKSIAGRPEDRFPNAAALARNLRSLEERRAGRALEEALRRAEEEARQREIAEEQGRRLQAACDQARRADEMARIEAVTSKTRSDNLPNRLAEALADTEHQANICLSSGRTNNAASLHAQVLDIRKRVLGPEHPNTLTSMNNLANVCRAQGKYGEAETLHTQTLDIRKRVLGSEHPDTLLSMMGLTVIYHAQGKRTEARSLHAQLLDIQRRVLGPEHPDALMSMNSPVAVGRSQHQKLAALLILLGEESASSLLNQLDEHDGELVAAEIGKLPPFALEQQSAVLKEFTEMALQANAALGGSIEYTRAVLEKAVGVARAAEIMGRIEAQQTSGSPKTERRTSAVTVQRIVNELPAARSRLEMEQAVRSKLEMEFGMPERITIEVLKELIRQNPLKMSRAAGHWPSQTIEEQRKMEKAPSVALSRLQKLAALLILLGEDSASVLFKHFEDHERERVAAEMVKLPRLTFKQQTALLNEFTESAPLKEFEPRLLNPPARPILSSNPDEPEELQAAKSKLVMDFGLGQLSPVRITIEVLKQLIQENPMKLSQAARIWTSSESPGF